MKKAIKAISVNDKFYNLERIHSKLFNYFRQNKMEHLSSFEKNIINSITSLISNAECFSNNIESKYKMRYVQSLKTLKGKIELKENYQEIFLCLCNCHSTFSKFRKKYSKITSKGCELVYQDVCVFLLPIEHECKMRRINSRKNPKE